MATTTNRLNVWMVNTIKKMDIQYNDDGDGRHSHNSQNESIILNLLTLTLQITLIQKSSTKLRLNP